MKTEQLNYYLPSELIAQEPAQLRTDSKLLVLDRCKAGFIDSRFSRIADFLRQGDCLVLNDTKVLPARFFGNRATGGKVEGLFLAENQKGIWQVMLKPTRKIKTNETLLLRERENPQNIGCKATLIEKSGEGRCLLKLETDDSADIILERIGFPPLPPYIKRTDDASIAAIDKDRYQTVFARRPGAVAAPTAGLHFTEELIEQLKDKKITFAYITLHVGAGTFKPVETENLLDHQIHQEWFGIDNENACIINQAKERNSRIIAVGTTSVRTLESVAVDSRIKAQTGNTQLFITPGYQFKIVDAIITNFHLPRSTLLALVAAFAGLEKTLTAYQHAIEQRYRFYSYGDAMLIL